MMNLLLLLLLLLLPTTRSYSFQKTIAVDEKFKKNSHNVSVQNCANASVHVLTKKTKKINVHKWESLFKNAYILFIAVYIFFMCN